MCTILCSLVVGPGSVEWLRRLSIVPGLAGLPLAFVPFYTLSKYGKTVGRSYMSTAVLVDRGPYALVRHPQYLAYILFVIVFVLQAQHPLVAILGSFTALLFHRMAMREERSCARRFGGAYGDYARRVPRYNLAAGVYRWLRRKSS